MKPIKNHIYCIGCRKSKMLFETQAKADNFIKYNSEGIKEENGKAPVRSYYCEFCGGYHVTSNPSALEGERLNTRDQQKMKQVERYGYLVEEVKKLQAYLLKKNEEIRILLCCGESDRAQDIIDVCSFELDDFFERNNCTKNTGILTSNKLMRCRQRLEILESMVPMVQKIESGNYDSEEMLALDKKAILNNAIQLKKIRDAIEESTVQASKGQKEEALTELERSKDFLADVRGVGHKDIENKYRKLLTDMETKIQSGGLQSSSDSNMNIDRPVTKETVKHSKIDQETYRKTILELIERLDQIKASYENGNYEDCISKIEVGYMKLEGLGVEDENVELLKRQFEKWESISRQGIV